MPKRSWGDEFASELIREEFVLDDDEEAEEDRLDVDGELRGFELGDELASEERLMAKEDDGDE